MSTNLSSFKRLCSSAVDVFGVAIIALALLFPALLCTVGIMAALEWVGLQKIEAASPWIAGAVFVAAYFPMLAAWLFKSYGARPGFISFCGKHRRFGAATMWSVNAGAVTWGATIAAARMTGNVIENVFEWIGKIFGWVAKSLAVLIVCIIIGGILYAHIGALSAPWWALVIIYLLLTKK